MIHQNMLPFSLVQGLSPILTLPSDLTANQLTSCSQKQKEQNEDIVIFCHATLGFGYHAMLAQARAIENLASSPFPLPLGGQTYGKQDLFFCQILFTVFNGVLTSKAIQWFCIT